MVRFTRVLTLALLALLCSGCFFLPSAVREERLNPGSPRWWCTAPGLADLDRDQCRTVSAQLDLARDAAHRYPRAADAKAAGAASTTYAQGIGARFVFAAPHAFKVTDPDTLLYTGTGNAAQLAGIEWNVPSSSAPQGFTGDHDVWTEASDGLWRLRVWIIRPLERHDAVFASSHPCLPAGGPIFNVGATCYISTHTEALRILVSNDDGYAAAGIDAVVEALRALPGVTVTVVAPATNQSGTGEQITDGPLTATAQQTLSGYPATAVDGFPADSIIYALRDLHLNPDLVVTGLNQGQNLGPVAAISGTVGAARRAVRYFIPAVATSQGVRPGSVPDYPTGVTAVLAWVRDFRLGRTGPPFQQVANLNIPTCATGSSVRGTVVVPLADALDGRPYGPGDCTSTQTNPADDIDGFNFGYVTLSDAGLG